jgi:hypothetical protein
VGDTFKLKGGQGDFYFTKELFQPLNIPKSLVLLAGGIGGTIVFYNIQRYSK